MSLNETIARLALDAAADPDHPKLQALLASNMAAAIGVHHSQSVRSATPADGPMSVCWQLAVDMHARTQDDFYPAGRVHIGAVVIPAILAVGGPHLMPALAAGYEILTLVAEAYAPMAQSRGFRPTGLFGPIGAAVAAAVARESTDKEIRNSISIASVMSSGTNQSWLDGSDEWLVEMAHASTSGVHSAQMAAVGVRASDNSIDGPSGWANAFFGDPGARRLQELLGEERSRVRHVAQKLYPVSGIAQVATVLAAQLRKGNPPTPPDRIIVRMNPAELEYPGTRNRGPFVGRSDSLMSVSRCVALAFLHGRIPYRALLSAPDPIESTIIDKVTLVSEDGLPEGTTSLTLETPEGIQTLDGTMDEYLYPSWEELAENPGEMASRFEAPHGLVNRLVKEIAHDPSSEGLVDIWRASQ